jgi:hypothetical protein
MGGRFALGLTGIDQLLRIGRGETTQAEINAALVAARSARRRPRGSPRLMTQYSLRHHGAKLNGPREWRRRD